MLQVSAWVRVVVSAIVLIGLMIALPNALPESVGATAGVSMAILRRNLNPGRPATLALRP